MIKYIMYYYNLKVTNLNHHNEKYYFECDNNRYVFEECNNEFLEKYYYELEYQIRRQGYKKFAQIIKNRKGFLITRINQKSYVLIKNHILNDREMDLEDIEICNDVINIGKLGELLHYPWEKYWKRKVDFFESWIESKGKTVEKNRALINFFVGLSENAINYFNKISIKISMNIDNDSFSLQHWRINPKTLLCEYYDINNLILDHSSRDVGEYIKSQILSNKFDMKKLIKYIDEKRLTKEWIELLYARILFPTYFYDKIEYSINNDMEFEFFDLLKVKIDGIIKKLTLISIEFSKLYKIETIEWLKKTDLINLC